MSDILKASRTIANNGRACLIISPATMLDPGTGAKIRAIAAGVGLIDAYTRRELPPTPLVVDIEAGGLYLDGDRIIDLPGEDTEWEDAAREHGQAGIFLAVETVGTTDHFESMLSRPKTKKLFYGLGTVA